MKNLIAILIISLFLIGCDGGDTTEVNNSETGTNTAEYILNDFEDQKANFETNYQSNLSYNLKMIINRATIFGYTNHNIYDGAFLPIRNYFSGVVAGELQNIFSIDITRSTETIINEYEDEFDYEVFYISGNDEKLQFEENLDTKLSKIIFLNGYTGDDQVYITIVLRLYSLERTFYKDYIYDGADFKI